MKPFKEEQAANYHNLDSLLRIALWGLGLELTNADKILPRAKAKTSRDKWKTLEGSNGNDPIWN